MNFGDSILGVVVVRGQADRAKQVRAWPGPVEAIRIKAGSKATQGPINQHLVRSMECAISNGTASLEQGASRIAQLPNELLLAIISHATLQSALSLTLVS